MVNSGNQRGSAAVRTLVEVLVRAPASSANLGPGFDCLAMALDIPFWLAALVPGSPDPPDVPGHSGPVPMVLAEPTHPASVAFRSAGGDPAAELWWRSPIPPGRGQGFSGAARVAGAFAARRIMGAPETEARGDARAVAAELEGHADNAAASSLGGFTVSAGDTDIRLAIPADTEVALWWPDEGVGTDQSRQHMVEYVTLADAAFNVAHAALWVAAMGTGDLGALRVATEDRLHQSSRLAALPESSAALGVFLEDPEVWGAWLSGSGPTVAALVPAGHRLGTSFPEGRVAIVGVDTAGVVEVAEPAPAQGR